MNQVLESFSQSVERFREALALPKNVANRDSAIKRFEFTFELSWKAVQKALRPEGVVCRSPRECFEAAFKIKLMADDGNFKPMIEDRNLTVHTYDEETAQKIYAQLPLYLKSFEELLSSLLKRGDS